MFYSLLNKKGRRDQKSRQKRGGENRRPRREFWCEQILFSERGKKGRPQDDGWDGELSPAAEKRKAKDFDGLKKGQALSKQEKEH